MAGALSAARGASASNPQDCMRCAEVEQRYSAETSSNNLFIVHTTRDIVKCGQKNRLFNNKKKTLQEIEKKVAALGNTLGGELIIHVHGQYDSDKYLEYFDEFITKRFSDLIGDGTLYVQTYVRKWLSELSKFSEYSDFILIKVRKSRGIVTVDYNTKVRNDIENINPSTVDIASIVTQLPREARVKATIRGLPTDQRDLHECRSVELKKLFSEKYEPIKRDVRSLVEYIWSDLKLKENISAISKVKDGGSYYVGIGETANRTIPYETKIPEILGFKLLIREDEFVDCLHRKIIENTCVLHNRRFETAPPDLTAIQLHKVQGGKVVLEVAISFFDGLVFHDKEGPRTYFIQGNKIHRMKRSEWLRRLNRLTYHWSTEQTQDTARDN